MHDYHHHHQIDYQDHHHHHDMNFQQQDHHHHHHCDTNYKVLNPLAIGALGGLFMAPNTNHHNDYGYYDEKNMKEIRERALHYLETDHPSLAGKYRDFGEWERKDKRVANEYRMQAYRDIQREECEERERQTAARRVEKERQRAQRNLQKELGRVEKEELKEHKRAQKERRKEARKEKSIFTVRERLCKFFSYKLK